MTTTPAPIVCAIYRDPAGDPGPPSNRGLIRVAKQEVPGTSTTPEADAWRTYTRTNNLPDGSYVVMRLGRRYKMEATTSFKSTDLGQDA